MDLRFVEVAQVTDTGRVREHNEDRLYANPPLLAVADGMGGAKAGEVAAQMTVDRLADTGPAPSPALVLQAIADANREIRELSAHDEDHAGMGTTVTAVVVGERVARVMHVGDSRAYVIRRGQIRQVTQDHSLVAEMVRQGTLTPEEAERHPSRNIITRVLGAEADVQVDEVELALEPDDIVLICSDGLSTMISADTMVQIAGEAPSLRDAAQRMVRAALDAGGTDNVTVVLGRIGASSPSAALGGTAEMPAVAAPDETEPTVEVSAAAVAAASAPTPGDAANTDESPSPAADTDGDTADEPTVEATAAPPADAPTRRTAAVLEPMTSPKTGTVIRRIAWLGALVVACVIAFGVWIGSRSYFVDAKGDADTIRVYHGGPFSILGIDFYREWADTHIAVDRTTSPATPSPNSGVTGQGDAVRRAVSVIWTHGVPELPVITPPPPKPTPPPATGTARTST